MTAWANLAMAVLAFAYQPAGRFADPGPCDSAARSAETFAAACRLGVWSGRAGRMELTIACAVRDARVNRVRELDPGRFLASTACGLFLVRPAGEALRLPFCQHPGALDADGEGRALVVCGSELWRLNAALQFSRVASLTGEDEEEPVRIQLAGDYLLVQGSGRRLLHLPTGARTEMHAWGRVALFGSGRQLVVHASGAAWNGAAGTVLERIRKLPLGHSERVNLLVPLGNQVLAVTSRQLILIGEGRFRTGRLPPAAGNPVPVRGEDSGGLPWMLVDGRWYRPVADGGQPAATRLGWLLEALTRHQGLASNPADGCQRGWLPRLEFRLSGGRARALSLRAGNHWSFSAEAQLGFMLGLSWSLDELLYAREEREGESLRRELRQEKKKLEESLAGWLEVYRQQCRAGDRLGVEETRELLRVMTGQEVDCQLE